MSFQLADGTEILGLSLKGPPPLGRIYFEFTPQVTALYGLNGAGKSRLLEAILGALRGYLYPDGHQDLPPKKHAGPILFVRVPHPSAARDIRDLYPDFAGALCDVLLRQLRSRLTGLIEVTYFSEVLESIETPRIPPTIFEEPSPADVVRWIATVEADTFDEPNFVGPIRSQILDEIAQQGLFALTATGWSGSPRWEISVAATPSDDTPALSTWVTKCREALRTFKESQEDWPPRDFEGGLEVDAESLKNLQATLGDLKRELPWGIPPVMWDDTWEEAGLPHWLPFSLDSKSGSFDDITLLPDPIVEGRATGVPALGDAEQLGLEIEIGRSVAKAKGDQFELFEMHAGKIQIGTGLRDLLKRKADWATKILREFLLGAPILQCEFKDPDTWLFGTALTPQWKAVDTPSGESVDLSGLSRAQLRWASVAIRLAQRAPFSGMLRGGESPDAILLVDEPEEALHVLAERHLVRGLQKVASEMRASAVVATHSREFLNAPDVRVVHVFRSPEGVTRTAELTSKHRAELGAGRLGLTEADLLQYFRVFLVVEGEHDEAVLQAVIGDELQDAATRILKLRGSWSLRYPSFEILFDFSSARFVVPSTTARKRFQRLGKKPKECTDRTLLRRDAYSCHLPDIKF